MRSNNTNLGIACIVAGMGISSLMDASIKALSGGYPLHEIVMVRSVIAIFLTAIIVHIEGGLALLKTTRPFIHLARGLLIVVANMSFYMAMSVMPLVVVTGLFFSSPLFITMLSKPFLGEQVGWRRWAGILVGFIGVLLIIQPGSEAFDVYSFLPIVAALAYATTQILSRRLGTTDKASVMSFYIGITFIVVSLIFWAFFGDGSHAEAFSPKLGFLFQAWHWPTLEHGALMGLIGILVTGVGYFLSQAYRVAEASAVAPFEFVMLPLALFWGYIFWGEVPGLLAGAGILLIVASSLYVFWRENKLSSEHN